MSFCQVCKQDHDTTACPPQFDAPGREENGIKDSERRCMWCGGSVWIGKHGLGNCATLIAPTREVVVRYAGIMPTPEQVKLDTERLAAIGFTLALRLDTSRDTAQGEEWELTREQIEQWRREEEVMPYGTKDAISRMALKLQGERFHSESLQIELDKLRSIQHAKEVKG